MFNVKRGRRLLVKAEQQGCYPITAISALIGVLIVTWIKPDAIPYDLFKFWHLSITVPDLLAYALPVFIWGCSVTLIGLIISGYRDFHPAENFAISSVFSFIAGVFEEISFRWAIFFSAMIGAQLINWLFFGFAGQQQ